MAKPPFSRVLSITEYVGRIDALLEESKGRNAGVHTLQNWYRGISASQSYRLQPSLFRINKDDELAYLNLEASMMKDFDRHAILRQGTAPGDEDKREPILKLFHMQHYGIPTRLLDWTTNPFIALYFALSSDLVGDEDPAVWVIDPWSWNRQILKGKSWKDKGPAVVSDPGMAGYHPKEIYDARELTLIEPYPAAIVGVYNTERMRAQRGVFTIFGKESTPMEDVYDSHGGMPEGVLHRIDIDRAAREELFKKLLQMGYTDSVSYPDFFGVAREIRRTYGYSI